MPFDPSEAYFLAGDVLQCIKTELAGTEAGIPEGFDSCVTHGNITWDNCCLGMLRVAISRVYPTSRFPDQDLRPNVCQSAERAIDLRAVVLRCAPGPDNSGNPPKCEALDRNARELAQDFDAMWRGVRCCFKDTDFNYAIRSADPLGPRGQCSGWSLIVTVGLTDWCFCG